MVTRQIRPSASYWRSIIFRLEKITAEKPYGWYSVLSYHVKKYDDAPFIEVYLRMAQRQHLHIGDGSMLSGGLNERGRLRADHVFALSDGLALHSVLIQAFSNPSFNPSSFDSEPGYSLSILFSKLSLS